MRFRALFLLVALCLVPLEAQAASRFWVGGSGTWDASDTTHWAASTGGAGGQSVPGASDTITLDASSGGGTVSLNTNVASTSITMGAFTGTLDFSANGGAWTVALGSFSGTGSGVRALTMGSGLWTLTTSTGAPWDMTTTTNLTFTKGTSNITLSGTGGANTFAGGALTYNTVTLNASNFATQITGANTFGALVVGSPRTVRFPGGATTTISAAFSWVGTPTSQILILSASAGTAATVAATAGSTAIMAGFQDMTFTGSPVATYSFNFGNNSGITVTAPPLGRVIGGL